MVNITAIIPVYNVERCIDRCLSSVINQTSKFYEVILVDDGSTDKSGVICDSYSSKYSYIKTIHQSNKGVSAARNRGIKEAKGNYITFIDSDDLISNSFVTAMSDMVEKYDCDIACTSYVRCKDAAECERLFNRKAHRDELLDFNQFIKLYLRFKGNIALHYPWGKIYKRNILDEKQYPEGYINEDVEGTFKAVIKANRFVYSSRIIYGYLYNSNSITTKNLGDNYLNLKEVWERVYDLAIREKPEIAAMVKYNVLRSDFTILCDVLLHGDSCSDDKYSRQIEESVTSIKANYWQIIKGPMPPERKLVLTMFVLFFNEIRKISRLVEQR